MGRAPYSKDIRGLVVAEVGAGASRRAAARRFRVSASSAIRWVEEHGETGRLSPRPRRPGGHSPLDGHATWLLALIAAEPDLTLAEVVRRIFDELGVATTDSSVSRFFARHGISFKKKSQGGRAGSARRG